MKVALRASRAIAFAITLFASSAGAATPPVGFGPSFRVKGAAIHTELNGQWMTELGGRLVFFGDASDANGATTRGLWITDGRTTTLLARVNPGFDPHRRSIFARLGDALLFPARDLTRGFEGIDDVELWRTDGTPGGTSVLKDLNPGLAGSYPIELTSHRGAIYFVAGNGTGALARIYRTDGTADGTVQVMPLAGTIGLGALPWLTSVGDTLYFSASDGPHGLEPWKLAPCAFDPSIDCPSMVADVYPDGNSFPRNLTALGGKLVFDAVRPIAAAGEPVTGLFSTDGTAEGTTLLAPLWVQSDGRDGRYVKALGDRAFAVAYPDGTGGEGLWVTDGTPGNLEHLFDGFVLWSDDLTTMGGNLYFHAGRSTPGFNTWYTDGELWRSDGTPAGTARVKDICPGDCSSVPGNAPPLAVEPEGYLFFTAIDPEHGEALWRSDGTEAGTILVEDRGVGGSATPWSPVRAGDFVYFGLPRPDEDPYGQTLGLWAVPIDLSDRAAPELSCPTTEVRAEATSGAGATVSFAVTARDNLTPEPTLVVTPAAGSSFALGATAVSATATDSSGNAAVCRFDVRVVDTTPPAVICPADVVAEATSAAGAIVSWPPPAARDVVSEPLVAAEPPPGSAFPLGRTAVAVTAADAAANRATCGFAVTVVDTTPPALQCPVALVLEANSAAGATGSWTLPTAVDAVSAVTVAATHDPGAPLPLGDTEVVVIAVDALRNASTCGFTVRVVDTTPPVIACPADVAVTASGPAGAAAIWGAPVATDAATVLPLVTLDHASGETFPAGDTVVHATATDEAGLTASCAFRVRVTVAPPPPPPPATDPGSPPSSGSGCAAGPGGPLALLGLAALRRRRPRG